MLKKASIVKQNFKISNLNLNINKGEVCFLLGTNGSGKTTILKCISGLIRPTEGKVEKPENLFYLPSDPHLDPYLRVRDVFEILDCDKKLENWLSKEFEIDVLYQKLVSQISTGEYKRVMLASSLSYKSKLFLLDEPLVFLDQIFQYKLSNVIQALRDDRKYLITTHNFNWCLLFSDANAVLINSTLSKKQSLVKTLEDENFKKTFKLHTKVTDNPIDGSLMLATARF